MIGGEQSRCLNRTSKTNKHKKIGKDKMHKKKENKQKLLLNRRLMLDLGMYLVIDYLAILM